MRLIAQWSGTPATDLSFPPGKLLALGGVGNNEDSVIFGNVSTAPYHVGFAYDRANKPALLPPIAGALQDDGVRVKNGAACLRNLGETYVARAAVLWKTFFVGSDVMSPKERNFVRSRFFTDAVTMLLAVPDEVAGLRRVAVVSEGCQSWLKKRRAFCAIRQRPNMGAWPRGKFQRAEVAIGLVNQKDGSLGNRRTC